MPLSRRAFLSAPAVLASYGAVAAEPDPAAVATIRQFYDGLLAVMKAAKTLPFDQRYERLSPLIQRTFDLGLMTRIAVGPNWAQFKPDQQQRLAAAFARYTISQYAGRFDGYAGERFDVNPTPVANPNGVVVLSKLVEPNGDAVVLNYLMRRGPAGNWQVIDVFLSGTISELATRRSEFSGLLQSSGPDGLARALDQRSAALRAG